MNFIIPDMLAICGILSWKFSSGIGALLPKPLPALVLLITLGSLVVLVTPLILEDLLYFVKIGGIKALLYPLLSGQRYTCHKCQDRAYNRLRQNVHTGIALLRASTNLSFR